MTNHKLKVTTCGPNIFSDLLKGDWFCMANTFTNAPRQKISDDQYLAPDCGRLYSLSPITPVTRLPSGTTITITVE
jgi:hypothetical protein